MSIQKIINQFDLTNNEVEEFAENLTSGKSLKKLCKTLSNKVDEKKAFLFAKIYCQSILASSIEEIAPELIEERDRILKKDKHKLEHEKAIKNHIKTLRKIEEDLMLFLMEKKGKIPSR